MEIKDHQTPHFFDCCSAAVDLCFDDIPVNVTIGGSTISLAAGETIKIVSQKGENMAMRGKGGKADSGDLKVEETASPYTIYMQHSTTKPTPTPTPTPPTTTTTPTLKP